MKIDVSTESYLNQLEQYRRRKNILISGLPGDVTDDQLGETVIKILADIYVVIETSNIEAYHRFGKSDRKKSSKKTIISFPNKKHCK